MKRVLIGGFLSLIGTVWGLAVLLTAENNLVSGWSTPPGRLLSTIMELGVMPLFVLALLLAVSGLVILVMELFRKDR
ncbi:hypothetical protein CE91St43_00550 [Oscillospiraceae bacterium]|nr:hypothetical protein CE91St43_00550 [Oscillospiraceae bacterium]